VACASAERRGSEGTAGAPCLLPSTVAARAQQASRRFCRAPSPGAAAARAQQPGANERFGFWALFGPVWPRRAPRGSRAPTNCMSTQGRGSKQGPGFFKPRSPSAMARPWPFQKGSGYKGAVLERGAPLARKIHKDKIIHPNHGHEISPVVSAWAPFVCGCFSSIAGVANFFVAPPRRVPALLFTLTPGHAVAGGVHIFIRGPVSRRQPRV